MTVALPEEGISEESRAFSEGLESASLPGAAHTQGSLQNVPNLRPRQAWLAVALIGIVAVAAIMTALFGIQRPETITTDYTPSTPPTGSGLVAEPEPPDSTESETLKVGS